MPLECGVTLSPAEWREFLGVAPPPSWPRRLVGVHPDSRRIRPGDLFVAVEGAQADGAHYVADALRRGAVGVVAARMPAPLPGVPVAIVPEPRVALARLASALYGHPARSLKLVGITGTNGKTTVAFHVRQLMEAFGVSCGLLGTVVYAFGSREIPARRTTPGPPELQQLLRQMLDANCSLAVMEVSSHALDQARVAGMEFDTVVFTNLTQDHLDYHGTMEAYFAAKARLFEGEALRHRIVGEDEWSVRLARRYPVLRCGLSRDCEVRAEGVEVDLEGIRARVRTPWGEGELKLPSFGVHNLRNALQAIAVCGVRGFPLEGLLRACGSLAAAPGRLEAIPSRRGRVFVDYAHTPDAVANVLGTLRSLTRGRLLALVGCGGDRDRGKRPGMCASAALADYVILTNDNPRSEDPGQIFGDMLPGLPAGHPHEIVPDRAEAIRRGVRMLEEGDILVICGKGHETVQEVGALQIPFDDREVARRAVDERDSQGGGHA